LAHYTKLKNWHSDTGKKYLPPTTTTNGVKTSRTRNAIPLKLRVTNDEL